MAHRADSHWPDDGTLVGYLDGALDPQDQAALDERLAGDAALRARLDGLASGGRPFAEAYDTLLADAPRERLEAILAEAVAAHGVKSSTGPSRWLVAMAAAIALFVAGIAVGYLLPAFNGAEPVVVVNEEEEAPSPPNWRQVVAEYQSLTTAESLAIIPQDVGLLPDELTAIGGKLALELTADKLALPHVYLKQAQLLEFRGMPLAKLSYLSRDLGPIAFCIIANGREDAGFAYEEREGSNIVYWTKNGRGYMLIGKAPRQDLETFATDLASRVA
jgi:anti-sigma factor RsiW